MKKNTSVIIIIAGSLIAVGLAYWYFFTNNDLEPALTVDVPISGTQAKFEALVNQLPASLDTTILSDPRFATLVDITVPISPEPAGRADPLAPLSSGGGQ